MIVSHHPPWKTSELIDGSMVKAETSHTSHTPIPLLKEENSRSLSLFSLFSLFLSIFVSNYYWHNLWMAYFWDSKYILKDWMETDECLFACGYTTLAGQGTLHCCVSCSENLEHCWVFQQHNWLAIELLNTKSEKLDNEWQAGVCCALLSSWLMWCLTHLFVFCLLVIIFLD